MIGKRYYIFLTGILISIIAESFSIYGLSKLFAGHQVAIIVMGIAFAIAKLLIAMILKLERNVEKMLRSYLYFALVVLSLLTSVGIYGFLSHSYTQTKSLDNTVQAKVQLLKKKKELFDQNLIDAKQQLNSINISVSDLRKSLSTDQQTQQVVKGQVITNILSTSKKGVQDQLDKALIDKEKVEDKINTLHDSVSVYDVRMIDVENSSEVASELGPLKYMSTILNTPMDNVVNWLMLMIVFIFDPLALCLLWVYFQRIEPTKSPEATSQPEPEISPEPVQDDIQPVKKPRNITKPLGRPRKKKEINEMIDSIINSNEPLIPPVPKVSKIIPNPDLTPGKNDKKLAEAIKKKV